MASPAPARLAPLWRSSGRCLALRPRKPVTVQHSSYATQSSVAAAVPGPAVTTAFQRRLQLRQAAPLAPASVFGSRVRGYADDATTRANGGGSPAAIDGEGVLLSSAGLPLQSGPESEAQQQAQQLPQRELSEQELHELRNQQAIGHLELMAHGVAPFDAEMDGHKFGLTVGTSRPSGVDSAAGGEVEDQALPRTPKMRKRYDDSVAFLTRLLMRDGKLAKAQRDMALLLNHLRTSAPPKLSPSRPLLAGHPPAAELPLDPVRYLTVVIDSLAPLTKINNYTDLGGGGRSLPVPAPLALRQRRRTAFMWIVDYIEKRPSRGSGRTMLAARIGDEIVAIAEGRSSLWEKRDLAHKMATAGRANLILAERRLHARKR